MAVHERMYNRWTKPQDEIIIKQPLLKKEMLLKNKWGRIQEIELMLECGDLGFLYPVGVTNLNLLRDLISKAIKKSEENK